MDYESIWREYFTHWPAEIPTRGVVVTTTEQVPFISFLSNERILILERMAPDTSGARRVMVPFASIQAVKLTEVVREKSLRNAGFVRSVAPQIKSAQPQPH